MKKTGLIVAGGNGTRMGSEIPKQFMLLRGKPVLIHTLQAFASAGVDDLILVLPQNQLETWQALCLKHGFNSSLQIVTGGATRFHSVRNGLSAVNPDALVAIHDGARPLVDPELIRASFEQAAKKGNAIAAVPLKDSIRKQKVTGETKGQDRSGFYLVQTPQTFRASEIIAAYQTVTHENFTDDAGVLEESGKLVYLINGDYRNLKITTPEDLVVAEALLGVNP